MRSSFFLLLAAAYPALGQDASSYVSGLLQTLNSSGLTSLVEASTNISSTSIGQALFADLSSGNKTLFAPNNRAFTGSPPSNITDPNQLAAILSYHVAAGSFLNFSEAPTHTLLRTALNSSDYVTLEGNKSQVLVLASQNGSVKVLQQNTPVTVLSTTTYQNLIIHVVDAVIDIPPTLDVVIASHNLTSLAAAAQQNGIIQSLESARGITLFAPNDQAFSAVNQTIGSSNASLLQTVLGNHIINGTSIYSTQLATGNYTSASGEPFQFSTNSSGTYVTSGPSTARIVTSDVIFSNGVLHVIDGVLLNTQNNTEAASSAYASATSVAGQPTTETGGVGATGTGSGGSPSSSSGNGNGNGNGAVAIDIPFRQCGVALIFALVGGALVL